MNYIETEGRVVRVMGKRGTVLHEIAMDTDVSVAFMARSATMRRPVIVIGTGKQGTRLGHLMALTLEGEELWAADTFDETVMSSLDSVRGAHSDHFMIIDARIAEGYSKRSTLIIGLGRDPVWFASHLVALELATGEMGGASGIQDN